MALTAQQLRSLSPKARKQIVEQEKAQQKQIATAQAEYDNAIAQSQDQQTDLQNRITQLRARIKELEYEESHTGYINPLEAASLKYGAQAELARMEELQRDLTEGKYYSNYSDLISAAKAQAKAISAGQQAEFNIVKQIEQAERLQLEQAMKQIPEGATIESIKGSTVTYSLPSQTRSGVTSQVKGFDPRYDQPQTAAEIQATIDYNKQVGKGYSPYFVSEPIEIIQTPTSYSISARTPNPIVTPTYINPIESQGGLYSPQLQGFISSESFKPENIGQSAVIRSPTYTEMQSLTKYEGGSFNLLTSNLAKQTTESKQLNKLDIKLKPLESKINKAGEWTGTDAELKEYNKLVDKYNTIGTRKVFGRDVDVRNFDWEKKPISSSFNVLTTTGSIYFGEYTKIKTGNELLAKKVEKVSKFGMDLGKYFIPVAGTGILIAETGEYGFDVFGTKQRGEKLSAEQKKEGLFLGIAVATGGIVKAGKIAIAKKTIIKPPKKRTTEFDVWTGTKMTYQKIPKVKKTTQVSTEKTGAEFVEGGMKLNVEPTGKSIIRTTTTGKRYKQVEYSDAFGKIIGTEIQRTPWGRFGKTKIREYKITEAGSKSPKIEEKFYREANTWLEGLSKPVKEYSGKLKDNVELYKFAEPVKSRYLKTKVDVTTRNGVKVRTERGGVIYKQKVVPVTDAKVNIKGGLTIKEETRAVALASPASQLKGVKVVKKGNQADVLKELKRRPARFSSKVSYDEATLGRFYLTGEREALASQFVSKSPRVQEVIIKRAKTTGNIEITPKSELKEALLRVGEVPTGRPVFSGLSLIPPKVLTKPKMQIRAPYTPLDRSIVNRLEGVRFTRKVNEKIDIPSIETSVRPFVYKEEYVPKVRTEILAAETLDTQILPTKTKVMTDTRVLTDLKVEQKLVQTPRTEQKAFQQVKQVLKQAQKQKQQLTQKQKQPLSQKPKQTFRQAPRTPKTKTPRTKPPKFRFNIDVAKKPKEKKLSKALSGFEAYVLKKGKAKRIGTFKDLPGAEKALGKELVGTLAASGFIERKGKKIKAKKTRLLGEEFRLSKTGDPFLIVERKQKRLRKGGTGKEIQFFR